MRKIPLTKGYIAIVDDEDYEWLSQWKWCACEKGHPDNVYAVRGSRETGAHRITHMHLAVALRAGVGGSAYIDHVNGNRLDNRRSNLRAASMSQNLANRGPQRNNSSGFKGVTFNRQRGKWRAQIRAARGDGSVMWAQDFSSKEEAAKGYDAKARQMFGEFAYLNFPSAVSA